MSDQKSLIEDLYTDSGGFDKERVAKILTGILSVQRGDLTIFTKPGIELSAEDKILAFAMVKKLFKNVGEIPTSSISGKEASEKTGLKKGTVDPNMQKLKTDGFLLGSGKSYDIPAHVVETVLARFEKYIPKQ